MRLRTFVAAIAAVVILSGVRGLHAPAPTAWRYPQLFEGTRLEATYTPTLVKSVQPVSITVASGAASNTATLSTAVTLGKALLLFQGNTTDAAAEQPCGQFLSGALTSATVVTATKGGGCTLNTSVYNGVVVEFLPQFVTSGACSTDAIASGSLSKVITISSVNTAKTVAVLTGWTDDDTNTGQSLYSFFLPRITVTSATQLTVTRGTSTGTVVLNFGYCYVEFK